MNIRRVLFFVCLVCFVGQPARAGAAPRTIVFFGDSLTAGYGLDEPAQDAFPGLIQKKIETAGLDWRVVNAGLSGETTAAGLRRVDWILRQHVDIFVLALGGNDGLRGISPTVSSANLQGIIDRVHAKYPQAKIVLGGMMMPTSMGADYTRAFAEMYPALGKKNDLTLIPFLLEGVGGIPAMNQGDRIHPNLKGHVVIAETLWKYLRPLL